jgi:flagellar protein FliS
MNPNINGYQAYKKVQVQTADQGQLILMCYDGAIKFLKQAMFALQNGDAANKTNYLTRAQNILWELTNSLNYETGEVAHNLDALYNYMIRQLIDADLHNKAEAIEEVIGHLNDIKSAWEAILLKSRA